MGGRGSSSYSSRNKYEPINENDYKGISVKAIKYGIGQPDERVTLTKPMTESQIRKNINQEMAGRPNNGLVNDLVTGRYAYYERFGNKYTLIFGDRGKGSKQKTATEFEGDVQLTNKKAVKDTMLEYMMTGKTKNFKTTRR